MEGKNAEHGHRHASVDAPDPAQEPHAPAIVMSRRSQKRAHHRVSVLKAALERRLNAAAVVAGFTAPALHALPVPQTHHTADYVASDAFLASPEWRVLRAEAIRIHGRRCMLCGTTPTGRDRINVDHVKPRLKYPDLALVLSNLQVLCSACNQGKGNWDETDHRQGVNT